LTLSNATRLLNDARLLVDHRRFASAFALAVLGVEEIGKVLLDGWKADKPLAKPKGSSTLHIQKQTAVSSLLLGALAVRTYPEGSVVEGDGEMRQLQKYVESRSRAADSPFAAVFLSYRHAKNFEPCIPIRGTKVPAGNRSSNRGRLSRLAGARPAQGHPWQCRQISFREISQRRPNTHFDQKEKAPHPPTDHYEAHESNRIGEDSSAHGSAPQLPNRKKG
jgi:hypothetical protein